MKAGETNRLETLISVYFPVVIFSQQHPYVSLVGIDHLSRELDEGGISGDTMIFYLKVDPDTLIITDCRWKTFSCASAIASTSVLSGMIKGMTLDDVYIILNVDIMEELGGLPDNKVHCSVLGDKALQEAINNYYSAHGMEDKVHDTESRIVCECLNVSEEEIEHAVLEGARNYYQLQEMTKVGTSCGKCEEDAKERLAFYLDKHFGIKEID